MSDTTGTTTDSTSTTESGSESVETEAVDTESTEGTEGAENAANESTDGSQEETTEETEGDDSKLTLDDAKQALAKVRQSEAKMRVRLREAEAALEGAKTPEEVEAVIQKMKDDTASETRELLLENVALSAGLPKEFHSRLVGATREELEADAKALAKLVGRPESPDDPELSGGLSPQGGNDPEVFDVDAARAAARKARSNRR